MRERTSSNEKSRETYGTRRILDDLRQQGQRVSRHRIGRLMRNQGLLCRIRRRFRATTNSNHNLAVAPNYLDQVFQLAEHDRVYVGGVGLAAA